jgi:hypothetical protein
MGRTSILRYKWRTDTDVFMRPVVEKDTPFNTRRRAKGSGDRVTSRDVGSGKRSAQKQNAKAQKQIDDSESFHVFFPFILKFDFDFPYLLSECRTICPNKVDGTSFP